MAGRVRALSSGRTPPKVPEEIMKREAARTTAILFLAVLLTSCYQPGGPIPQEPSPAAPHQPIPRSVVVEEETIYSPAPRGNGEPPDACDWIHFVRYRLATADGQPKEVNAILVMFPGFMGGANEFEYLGRTLVSMAEAEGTGSLEVWAIDRRPNCLEDLTGMNAAEEAGERPDPEIAVDYYYHGLEIGGRRFAGFLRGEDLPFLSEFGLELAMEDAYKIVSTKIPDPADRQAVVFVGGHSLGTALTGLFAGWDFDGNPETTDDAGYENCAGLILLDGPVFYDWTHQFNNIAEADYLAKLEAIRAGSSPRLDLFTGVTPETMALLEIVSTYAAAYPDQETTLFDDLPLSGDVTFLLKLLHSRDLGHFLTGVPALTDFRYTNEALLGVLMDDNFQPVTMLQASLGFLQGGAVVEKDFPGSLADLLGLRKIDRDGLFIAWDAGPLSELGTGPLYRWVNFDRIGDEAHPEYRDQTGTVTYTTMTEEVTDIQDFARLIYRGPSNFAEWYFPARLKLDIGAAASPFNGDQGLNFFHNAEVDVPVIAFGAPHGDVPEVSGWDAYRQSIASTEFTTLMAPGYNHMDIITAAADRPGRRPNEVFGPLLDFVLSHSGGRVLVPLGGC